MPRERRTHVVHYLDDEGMVACNPRDREAAHRAEVEGIATRNVRGVTCPKCRAEIRRSNDRGGPE